MNDGGAPPFDEESPKRAAVLLHHLHAMSAGCPIGDADAAGAFPPRRFRRYGYPVVVDANVLRNDILYSCRTGHRTTLVNASNADLLRTFVARHVVDEVYEHAEEWTAGSVVGLAEFLDCWQGQYLPLLRVTEAPQGLLDPDEQRRVDDLAAVDPDDVPSATLALALGAFFVSEDRRAAMAVYGELAGGVARREWLDVLRAGGDAGQVTSLVESASFVTVLTGTGFVKLIQLLVRRPSLLPPVAAVTAAVAARWPTERSERFRAACAALMQGIGDIALASAHADERFNQACVPPPDWNRLADRLDGRAVLTRRLMFDLARASGHRSAGELSDALGRLSVSHGETTVRMRLREHACFVEVYGGRWQLGARWQPA
jgi:predicted nucleic acid-binding protein